VQNVHAKVQNVRRGSIHGTRCKIDRTGAVQIQAHYDRQRSEALTSSTSFHHHSLMHVISCHCARSRDSIPALVSGLQVKCPGHYKAIDRKRTRHARKTLAAAWDAKVCRRAAGFKLQPSRRRKVLWQRFRSVKQTLRRATVVASGKWLVVLPKAESEGSLGDATARALKA